MFLFEKRHPLRRRLAGRTAFTMVEVLIASVISSVVIAGAVSFQYVTATSIKNVSAITDTRSSRNNALSQISYRLRDAKVGSCEISDGNHRLEYVNPTDEDKVCAFYFTEESLTLFFDDDIDDGEAARAVARGPIDVTFESESAGAIIKISVKTQGSLNRAEVDEQSGETSIYLRNN